MWVVVNIIEATNTKEYESWDIDLKEKNNRRSWLKTAVKTVGMLSYVPTVFSICKYLLLKK